MLHTNEEKLQEVIDRAADVLNDFLISQKLVLQALEDCDENSYEQTKTPLKGIAQKVEDIDQLILTVLARFSPEAKDLREMVAFLKITYSLQRIATNEKNYIKNMSICNPQASSEIKNIISESLAINKCTIRAIKYAIEMVNEPEDKDRLRELSSKISVEASKTDDIYSMIEKDILQNMDKSHMIKEEYISLLKYIRKNLKIIDRLDDIAEKILFARIGMTL
jgi:phosphate transport system protein